MITLISLLVILSNIAFVQNDMDMLDYCGDVPKQLSCEDIYDRFNLSPQSISRSCLWILFAGRKDLPNTIAKSLIYMLYGFLEAGKLPFWIQRALRLTKYSVVKKLQFRCSLQKFANFYLCDMLIGIIEISRCFFVMHLQILSNCPCRILCPGKLCCN